MPDTTAEFSQLSDIQEKCVIIDEYLVGCIGIIAAICYLFSVQSQLNKENKKYYQYAIYCAISSFIFSIIVFSLKLFVGNDMLIPYNGFAANKKSFVSTIDSLIMLIIAIERLCLYYGFIFHSQSLTDKFRLNIFLKCWMIGISILILVICTIYVIDDSLVYTSKEIGVSKTHNFHIVMYLGHEGATLIHYVLFAFIIIDIIYVIYISYLYIIILKQAQRRGSINVYVNDVNDIRTQGIKGVSLLIFVSVVFCFSFLIIALDLQTKYLFSNIIGICDNLGLFLILKANQRFYNLTCGRLCNNCWIKILYGTRYHAIYDYDSDSSDEQDV